MGLGSELAAGIAAFVLLGYWLDRQFDTGPTWFLVGSVAGCVGGLYHTIRRAIQMQREMDGARRERVDDDQPNAK